jgi:hypothetical protein
MRLLRRNLQRGCIVYRYNYSQGKSTGKDLSSGGSCHKAMDISAFDFPDGSDAEAPLSGPALGASRAKRQACTGKTTSAKPSVQPRRSKRLRIAIDNGRSSRDDLDKASGSTASAASISVGDSGGHTKTCVLSAAKRTPESAASGTEKPGDDVDKVSNSAVPIAHTPSPMQASSATTAPGAALTVSTTARASTVLLTPTNNCSSSDDSLFDSPNPNARFLRVAPRGQDGEVCKRSAGYASLLEDGDPFL